MRALKVVQLDAPAQWLTVPEVAVRLRQGQATIWRLIARGPDHGGIRSLKCGRSRRIPVSAIAEYEARQHAEVS
jgi:excisionase family DNA binding protein